MLFGDGICARIKEELLTNFNLHTIVRLPNGVFAPYTSIPTNLLFFDRSGPTKEIWYYELPLPIGRRQYTKTAPIQFEDAHIVNPEASYPDLGIYSFGRGLFKKPPIQGFATSAQKLYRVRTGQFIYSRLFAFEGAYGWVSDEFDGYFVSGEYPTFECDPERVKAEFLFAYFKSPTIWAEVSFGSKGLGDRRQRVKSDHFLRHRLLLPPMDWQERICETLAKVEMLKRLQSETAAELNALLPSILDKAFKGEL